ncbi:TPA: UDP-N-acetylmuramoyl-L-alanyl-D-glutamate--2,6-diaminopimelate ligase [Candidatus Collierbacteria bacterium]|nr:UDP-N-acetylmuramoyl-L-alanyl-D-glutamate--2,6-diaminopimelate ligase [Candidatus Collierbacteria bacterium]HAN22382.1 UDP-N-acetylmuramoyl-L-alanyl-D-glutamate--2,6-diaminopimelate ligase [Candidatus Collierbacteria bacterium]HBX64225.1 UDP-N-acetylmuramoyl-L-alanyl-D-glutamate--2,6-diaminopimelate ligase [Candidatus Collierbacteria bacterium]HCW31334.1 UDP-N-acetylmuramoyl-L-alanyl-D-glutamate--2,6-diaminopimelate ligase [Candidatus Collierbacteria bacterium]
MSRKFLKTYHFLRSVVALIFYRFPSRKLKVIGVTGTDGKTTTVTMIYKILKAAGKRVSMVSTVDAVIGSKKIRTGLHTTTPDPFLMQKLLRRMVDEGDEYAVLEVSSHGIDQFRVFGVNFLVGVLTNITREHLDYHGSFDSYLSTKAIFLKSVKTAVLNKSDGSYKAVRKIVASGNKIVEYPISSLSESLKKGVEKFSEPYNQLNAQAAIMATKAVGIAETEIVQGLASFKSIEGRMEEVKNERGIRIIVDFAHTPNALTNVLSILRKKAKKRVICVFGCAGERDREKRPVMGEIATRLADIAIFTAEDPRNESINDIINSMEKGALKGKKIYKIPERGEAIRFAINEVAKKDDFVVICGKGHERSMAYGKVEYPWSDAEAVKKALKNRVMLVKRPGV